MQLPILRYIRSYTVQTGIFVAMGSIWLANAIFLGKIIDPDAPYYGCGVGILNFVAKDWVQFAGVGFLGTTPLIAAFGFVSSWLTKGQRGMYALLIFLTPLFGLWSQNTVWAADSIRYYGDVYGPFAFASVIIGLFFLPAFYIHRRLTSRWSSRDMNKVQLIDLDGPAAQLNR